MLISISPGQDIPIGPQPLDNHDYDNHESLARFTSADTLVPPGVQGLNRYAYVNNDPLKYTDPSGHVACQGKNWDDGPQCKTKNPNAYNSDLHPEHFGVPLSPEAQDLIDFSKIVGRTPEEVIAIGIGHEMYSWTGNELTYAKQHFYNRYVDWARSNCGGYLTYNCELNFFMKGYQSVQNLVYLATNEGRANRIRQY